MRPEREDTVKDGKSHKEANQVPEPEIQQKQQGPCIRRNYFWIPSFRDFYVDVRVYVRARFIKLSFWAHLSI